MCRLDSLNHERVRVAIRLRFVEKEKQDLEVAKYEAEDYMLKENELLFIREKLFEIYYAEVKASHFSRVYA